jgi:hypothetical protein
MEIQALKIFNSIKLILFLILVLGVITVLTACGDLVKESDTGACDSAIDARNYDKALSVCTSRKDKASAYMGIAGYDIINLLKSSGTTTSSYTDPTGDDLGKDDNVGASILNILQRSVDVIADNDTRAEKITSSRTNLHSAYELLQPSLGDNSSSPLTTDEILLNTFAISFAMQLYQIMMFDNETTSKTTFPSGDAGELLCAPVNNVADNTSVLIPSDGHIWTAERDGMMCARIKNAVDALASGQASVVSDLGDLESGEKLPPEIYDTVCDPLDSLTTYLRHLALNLTELKKAISLSGDNTKVIEKADNSTKALMTAVGCKE